MNIFVTSDCPKVCAETLDNRRVIKMILETAQMLSTNIRHAYEMHNLPATDKVNCLYKSTHLNHPCTVWARTTLANHNWCINHLDNLLAEYTHRYGKTHKTTLIALVIKSIDMSKLLPNNSLTPFVNCSLFKNTEIHNAYKITLCIKWEDDRFRGYTPQWTKRTSPAFYNDYLTGEITCKTGN